MPRALLVALSAAAVGAADAHPLAAQAAPPERRDPPPVLGSRDALVVGAFALGALAAAPFDRAVAVAAQRPEVQDDRGLRRLAVAFRRAAEPGAVVATGTMWVVGRVGGNERLADAGLRGAEAIAVALAATGAVKLLAGRARPYVDKDRPHDFALGRGLRGSEWRAFPSGHTTVGFATAAAVTASVTAHSPDARWPLGGALYGAAALMGLSRIYDDRHWASDVVGGAGIGVVSGLAVARYHRTRPGNRLDRWLLGASVRTGGSELLVVPIVAPVVARPR